MRTRTKLEYHDGDIFELKLNFNLGYMYAKIKEKHYIDEDIAQSDGIFMFPFNFFPLLKLNADPLKGFNIDDFKNIDHLCGFFTLTHPPVRARKYSWQKVGNSPLTDVENIIPYSRASFHYHRFFKDEKRADWFCTQDELVRRVNGRREFDRTIREYDQIKHLAIPEANDAVTKTKYLTFVYMFELGLDPFTFISEEDFKTDLWLEQSYYRAKQTVLYKNVPKEKWNMV